MPENFEEIDQTETPAVVTGGEDKTETPAVVTGGEDKTEASEASEASATGAGETEGGESKPKEPEYFYDATAKQTFPFEVTEDDGVYETAHHYDPLDDERYVKFVDAIVVKGNEDEMVADAISAQEKLWNDLNQQKPDNFETDEEDWQSVIDLENEKIPSLNHYLAVAIVVPEKADAENGDRKVRHKSKSDTITVITEAYFNGKPVQQKHVIKRKTKEWSKKFNRIRQKGAKFEKVGGLRSKPNMIAVSQDVAVGKLYKEMFVSQEGFVDGIIPLRFQGRVINYIFAGKAQLNEKK